MYVGGWPPLPALILSPIEHFEMAAIEMIAGREFNMESKGCQIGSKHL